MTEREVVIVGSRSVRDAVGTATPRGWHWRRPDADLRHAARAGSRCVRLEHPDAPIDVLVARSEDLYRALLCDDRENGPDRDPERVARTVEDCPVIEDLVRELERIG